jgi:hypothetical protein
MSAGIANNRKKKERARQNQIRSPHKYSKTLEIFQDLGIENRSGCPPPTALNSHNVSTEQLGRGRNKGGRL